MSQFSSDTILKNRWWVQPGFWHIKSDTIWLRNAQALKESEFKQSLAVITQKIRAQCGDDREQFATFVVRTACLTSFSFPWPRCRCLLLPLRGIRRHDKGTGLAGEPWPAGRRTIFNGWSCAGRPRFLHPQVSGPCHPDEAKRGRICLLSWCSGHRLTDNRESRYLCH